MALSPGVEPDAAVAPSGLTAARAGSTVRRFMDEAVLQGNGYAACGLLTSSEQAAIARLADRAAYDAPSSPWRIARGAELVLPGAG